jgi:hypothetical protein
MITVTREPKPGSKLRNRLDDTVAWVAHMNEGKCKKCFEVVRYFEKESLKNMFFRRHRN